MNRQLIVALAITAAAWAIALWGYEPAPRRAAELTVDFTELGRKYDDKVITANNCRGFGTNAACAYTPRGLWVVSPDWLQSNDTAP